MADKESLIIDVTPEDRQRIEALARQHGYATPGDYLLALVDMQDDEPTKAQLIADLRQSLHEVATGQAIPAADFMAALDSDD